MSDGFTVYWLFNQKDGPFVTNSLFLSQTHPSAASRCAAVPSFSHIEKGMKRYTHLCDPYFIVAHASMVTMVTMGGDLQPGCLADRLLTGLGQPQINPERKRKSLLFC